ncbi:MAG: signal recognition particle-docking protein FtsY [Magnetovibrionaceae bacterium]
MAEGLSWLKRLTEGLRRSSHRLAGGISDLFSKRKLDDEALEDLEELLITADLGVATATRLSNELAKTRFGKEVEPEEIKAALAEEVAKVLEPVAKPLLVDVERTPHVVLVCGVNGAGKTTTIGKMASLYQAQGVKTMLAAGDTFRAAAVEQLQVWGERSGCTVVSRPIGTDAASLAYEAMEQAKAEGAEVLFIDTAGRLQNKKDLMAELSKILRVIRKLDETAPHDTLLVLDATTGQNAVSQVKTFQEMADVSGLVLTKLDGTAKGGVTVALAEEFGLPVHAIGVGEGIDDLQPFEAEAFARALMGLES